MAKPEQLGCPPGESRGVACQPAMACGVTHKVRRPLRRSPASYATQFVTLYFIFGIWWRHLALNLLGMAFDCAILYWLRQYPCNNANVMQIKLSASPARIFRQRRAHTGYPIQSVLGRQLTNHDLLWRPAACEWKFPASTRSRRQNACCRPDRSCRES